ncbi:MAG: InlB B-repeat-containing protein [Bacteroidaceae bacterium]|nr:InlB B-repeat-containing protein [Bacteroidaceae bacterium]
MSPSIEMHNGHEYVDLGLPSGLLWATCNVGAESPEDYGDYFAWGETSPKSKYGWDTYKYGSEYDELTKYCSYIRYSLDGFTDNKVVIDVSDDAARANWGGSWRMPTHVELDELMENCTWTFITQNGVNGYKATGPNGKSVFCPYAGCFCEGVLEKVGSKGFYWSGSLDSSLSYCVYCLSLSSFDVDMDNLYARSYGHSVRAVFSDTKNNTIIVNFDANSGEGEMSSLEISSETATLPINTFTRDGYRFIGWNTQVDGTGTLYSDGQEVYVKENLTLYAQWLQSSGSHNGYDYIDLGLPSGLKWATCNVGAYLPEYYGRYFAWGETKSKNNFSWNTYKYSDNGSSGYLTKYNVVSSKGIVDNKTRLDLEDDAAHENWGGSWRMPTYKEWDELMTECIWTWSTKNGTKGYNVTSKTNGNSIFLPAAGERYDTPYDNYTGVGYSGYYWSRSLYSGNPRTAYYLDFGSDYVGKFTTHRRDEGLSVHAVYSDVENIAISYIVNFDANGGVGEMSSCVIWSDEALTLTIPKNSFTRNGYGFIGWNTKSDGTGTLYSVGQEVSVKENVTLYAQWLPLSGSHNGYEYVFLGLPSGLFWATCNVGADTPEDYGDYFAWGETEPKSDYSWSTYKHCNNGSSSKLTKYNVGSSWGTIDNKTTLDLEDDAAHVNWGGGWRMPTDNELFELRTQCTWKWITQNGVKGYKVTSKTNGNSIFLPAAGYRTGTMWYDAGSYGYYWSSSLDSGNPRNACFLGFYSSYVGASHDSRNFGLSVRAVFP